MPKRSYAPSRPTPPAPQLSLGFSMKVALDQRQRAEVVALLSRLLLQAARALGEEEVRDDGP